MSHKKMFKMILGTFAEKNSKLFNNKKWSWSFT